MAKVKLVSTVLQYLSYLQLLITKITGHKIAMRKTKAKSSLLLYTCCTFLYLLFLSKPSQILEHLVNRDRQMVALQYLCFLFGLTQA